MEATNPRKRIELSVEAMKQLLDNKFSIPKIAAYFNVSVKTVKRRMKEAGISIRSTYAQISDQELDEIVAKTILDNPNLGIRLLKGILWSKHKFRVAEMRLRECMRRVDPIGVQERLRKNRAVYRRSYSVPYSNFLWHIDGNLKLSRYKMTIRSGIDGRSRLATFLEAGSDNKSISSLDSFMNGVRRYGVPSHTRTDKGGENVLIARFMLTARGLNAHFTGRSVHNQRIERFWRDVSSSVTVMFYNTFSDLETEGFLNVDDDRHMSILHLVYIPRLNVALEEFRMAWNDHTISTEGYNTPNQLFIMHSKQNQDNIDEPAFEDVYNTVVQYAPNYEPHDPVRNPIPILPCLTLETLDRMEQVDVLRPSTSNGKDIFIQCLQML